MSGSRTIDYIDLRPGSIARELGLLTNAQISEIEVTLTGDLLHQQNPAAAQTFEQIAMDKGWLDAKGAAELLRVREERSTIIEGYKILRIVGSGTIATTYYAKDLQTDSGIALKILHPRLARDPNFVQAYLNEAKAISRFHHPNIVQGLAMGESNGLYYFTHEFMSRGSFIDVLARRESFSESRLVTFLRQVNAGLKHAWAVAVYHGDINPGNLFLGDDGVVKLANLGVPRTANAPQTDSARFPGFIRAKPDYAAPEQLARPEIVNAATDMYSLGATLYHVSFGFPPFVGETPQQIVHLRQEHPMPSFPEPEKCGLSSKYILLLQDMMAVDPQKRLPDPDALSDRLEEMYASKTLRKSGGERQAKTRFLHPNSFPGKPFSLWMTYHSRVRGYLARAVVMIFMAILIVGVLLWLLHRL